MASVMGRHKHCQGISIKHCAMPNCGHDNLDFAGEMLLGMLSGNNSAYYCGLMPRILYSFV